MPTLQTPAYGRGKLFPSLKLLARSSRMCCSCVLLTVFLFTCRHALLLNGVDVEKTKLCPALKQYVTSSQPYQSVVAKPFFLT